MHTIPRPALILGLAGVLPFAAFALAQLVDWQLGYRPNFDGWLLLYGLTILSFMSGCVWAFAARLGDPAGYALSTVPALIGAAVLIIGLPFGFLSAANALLCLAVVFAALLLLDFRAASLGQTPEWWIPLRLLLTCLVIACLCLGALL